MGSQHLNLKWRNHHSNLLSVFGQLLSTESFTDVTLVCDGASIRAHKVILSACSPFFHNIFEQHPCQNPIIILKDVSHKDLKVLVDFMYSGEVNIAQEYLPSFLRTAESLKIKGLSENESSSGCSNSLKRNVQMDNQTSKAKRRRNSKNNSDVKSDDDCIGTPDGSSSSRKENTPVEMNVSALAQCNLSNTGGTDRYSSPMQRYEQAYNWGISTESSKYVEVNLRDDDTNVTGQSVGQDDSTIDYVGADCDSPHDPKPMPAHEEVPPDLESLRQLHGATGLHSTIAVHYSSLPRNNKNVNKLGASGEYTDNAQYEKDTSAVPPEEIGHVLTRLPRHKKKDCIVCGNRQAGQRRRSRQWCPGCNVGVHVHCFAKLEHYRRSNKRTVNRIEDIALTTGPEMVQIKCEPFSETNAESNVSETNAESNVESDAESSAQNDVEGVSNEMG